MLPSCVVDFCLSRARPLGKSRRFEHDRTLYHAVCGPALPCVFFFYVFGFCRWVRKVWMMEQKKIVDTGGMPKWEVRVVRAAATVQYVVRAGGGGEFYLSARRRSRVPPKVEKHRGRLIWSIR